MTNKDNKPTVDMSQWETEENLLLLQSWVRNGMTPSAVAKQIGISKAMLLHWIGQSKGIAQAMKKGKDVVDFEVMDSLYRSTQLYQYQEVTEIQEEVPTITTNTYYDQAGKIVKREQFVTKQNMTRKEIRTKVHLPEYSAISLWLRNRKTKEWQSSPELMEHRAAQIEKMKAETLEAKRKASAYERLDSAGGTSEFLNIVQGAFGYNEDDVVDEPEDDQGSNDIDE